jgi:hypothetical protein
MTPTQARDRAASIAKRDPLKALTLACAIPDPWFRAQALAYVARYETEERSLSVAMGALRAALEANDCYKAIAVAAWPIAAMVERGWTDAARHELSLLLECVTGIEPESSRSEALFLMFQAAFPLGDEFRDRIARALVDLGKRADAHWRSRRNLIAAIAILSTVNRALAASLADDIADGVTRRKAAEALNAFPPRTPRAFFRV